jgi:hypothetical protein
MSRLGSLDDVFLEGKKEKNESVFSAFIFFFSFANSCHYKQIHEVA